MSEQACCNFEVTKLENGFQVVVTGCDCQELIEKCLAKCCDEKGGSSECC